MKKVTSITLWNDAVGKRISMTYSEIDQTGKIINDSNRVDRVVTDLSIISKADDILQYANDYVNSLS